MLLVTPETLDAEEVELEVDPGEDEAEEGLRELNHWQGTGVGQEDISLFQLLFLLHLFSFVSCVPNSSQQFSTLTRSW